MYSRRMENSSAQRRFAADASCTMPHNSYNMLRAAVIRATALIYALIIPVSCLAGVIIRRLCRPIQASASA